jgi:DNA-binding CsgD family transcriptional regulator
MRTQEFQVEVGSECQSDSKIVVDINQIPYSTAVYIPLKEEVILNRRAYETLGMSEGEIFDLTTWRKINPYLGDCYKRINEDIVSDQKVHVILLNGKHEIMNYSLTRIDNSLLGKVYIIHFSKASEKYSVASISSLYSVKEEIAKLKPYLNRTGKVMHETLMKKYFREENQQLTLDDLVYYERELRIIQKAYPSLSHREVILCGLLVNDMDSKDIASITNRTLDAVFVTIHRINRKLDIINKKQLVDTLKDLVNKEIDQPVTITASVEQGQ